MLTRRECRGQYLLPHDDTERDRLDVMHTMFKTARDVPTRLLNAPSQALRRPAGGFDERPRVLDLGCGTGIWMLEMAQEFPTAEFVGVDMHYMGPSTLLDNVLIRAPWDYEGPWALGEGSWDLIHLQMGLGSISDWPGLYRKILRHLVPGQGWFESVEIDWQPRCDDGTLLPGRLLQWWDYLRDVFGALGRSLEYNERTGDALHAAGFKDIQHVCYRLPTNGWSHSPAEHRSGMWWNIVMSQGHESTGGYGLEAMSLAALTRHCHWPPDHARRLCNEALQEASDPSVHTYNNLHIWWARAPYPDEPR